ncbi:MAG TPA: substrate-binding domain-containing protein, partial [Thermomicrobiales bacterium]|nr:substrate-binding domain-containing protein [Thermomicrobiales bacterium]
MGGSGLTADAVDVAVVDATSAPQFANIAVIRPLPPNLELHDRIVFVIGGVVRDGVARPAARLLVEFLLSPEGQSLLHVAGFLPPP